MDEHLKHCIDAISLGTVLATLGGYMPEIAAAFSIIWTGIRIYETKTVQGVLSKVVKGKDIA